MSLRAHIAGLMSSAALGGDAWSPSVLFAASEDGAWYDPSDLSTLYQDEAGTTPVTTAGQKVMRMDDLSGNNNHATQAVEADAPTLMQDADGNYYLSGGTLTSSNSSLGTDATIGFSYGV